MRENNEKGLSRRDFIKGAAAGVVSVATVGVLGASSPVALAAETPQEASTPKDWFAPDNGMFDWRTKPEEPTVFAETSNADVIICGAGIAGLNAARRAAELGNSVIIVDKINGVSKKYEVHGFQCAAFNPKMMSDFNVPLVDEAEFFNAYMMSHGNRCNPDIIRLWMDESGPAFDWYEELMPKRATDGSKNTADYTTNYRSVLYWPRPQGYTTEGFQYKNYLGTVDFTYESWAHAGKLLYEETLKLGVQYRYSLSGYMLTRENAGGRVNGLIAKVLDGNEGTDKAAYVKLNAKKGVIISTGYHGTAQDIMKEIGVEEGMYTLRNGRPFPQSSGFGGSGDGHRMLVWEGAEIEPFRQADGTCLALLDPAAGLSINVLGKRWHNEDVPCWSLGLEMRWQPHKKAWKIYDKNWRDCLPAQAMSHMAIDCTAKTPWTIPPKGKSKLADGTPTDGVTPALDYLEAELKAGVGNPDGITIGNYWTWQGNERYGANTLDELADMMGLDTKAKASFLAEIEEYNRMCEQGKDTRYGKAPSLLFPIKEAPFYAFSTSTRDDGRMGQEGVMTNTRLQPIIPDTGEPIEGVYLAGVVVGGRHGNQYMTPLSGMNHGFCVTFGKLSAEYLTEDNK